MTVKEPNAPFSRAVYELRLQRLREGLIAEGFDAIVLFAQESLYYLTGFDSGGYVFFQAAVVPSDGGPITLLTRRPDRDQARATSIIEDVRIWYNAEDADPAGDLRDILAEKSLRGGHVALELATYGLTGQNHERVRLALEGFCSTADGSHLPCRLRLVKSAGEIELVRKAAELCDRALEAVIEATEPGIPDSALAAVCLREILLGGGDVPPAGPLVNSGSRAPYGRGVGGPRLLEERDQVIVEFAGTYRRYNVCVERTIVLGEPPDEILRMYEASSSAMEAMIAEARPGNPIGKIDEAHRRVLDDAGFAENRFAACGYSLGATYRPSWMDVPPMLYSGNPLLAEPGMVFFPHAILGDAKTGHAVGLGQTILITESGAEVLNQVPLELHRR